MMPVPRAVEIRCLSCSAKVGARHSDLCELAPDALVDADSLRFVTETPAFLHEFGRQVAAVTEPEFCRHLVDDATGTVPVHMMTWAPGLMLCSPCAVQKIPLIRDEGLLRQALCDSCQLVIASGLVTYDVGNLTVWAGLCVRCIREARPDGPLTEDSNHYAQAHHAIFGLAPAPACLSCEAGYGEIHEVACEAAACLTTGQPRLLCTGDHDHGFDRWDGARRGYLEAAELGWFAAINHDDPKGPWIRVESLAETGAFPDLARVLEEAEWDPERERFFPPTALHSVDRASVALPNGAQLNVAVLSAQQLHRGHWHTIVRTVTDPASDEHLGEVVGELLDDLRREVETDHTMARAA